MISSNIGLLINGKPLMRRFRICLKNPDPGKPGNTAQQVQLMYGYHLENHQLLDHFAISHQKLDQLMRF